MKLTNYTVDPTAASRIKGSGPSAEKKEDRVNRMTEFWQTHAGKVYKVGRLLASKTKGKTLAEHLIAGESIEMESITLNGTSYPLEPDYTISMDTMRVWGCPACHSAHGSGKAPSHEPDADGLMSNQWYYHPASKKLFVISDTCHSKYLVSLIGEKEVERRFVLPPTKPAVQVQPKPAVQVQPTNGAPQPTA